MSDRTVSVALKAKVDQYVAGMKKAEAATGRVKDRVEATAKQQQLLGGAASLVAGIGVVAAAKKMIGAASAFNETASKTQQVFKANSGAVLDWSKGAAKAMGMSEQQAAEAAATFGNLFTAMKIGQKPAADMSMKLVGLASDLASFNNVDPAEALDALRSGLVGETEPLRKFGVNLNDATLKQEALKLGLVTTTTQALDPATKAQAAYALILEQTKTAQGDFARTSDGLANSTRIFQAELADAEKNLGQTFLPMVNDTVHGLNGFLETFNGLPEPIQQTAAATGLLAAGLLVLAPRLLATKAAIAGLGFTGKGTALAIGKMGLALAGTELAKSASEGGDVINSSISNMSEFLTQVGKTGKGVDQLGYSVDGFTQYTKDFNNAVQRTQTPDLIDNLGQSLGSIVHMGDDLTLATRSVTAVDNALADMVTKGNAKAAADAYLKLRDSFVAAGGAGETFDAAMSGYNQAVDASKGTTQSLAAAFDEAGKAAHDASGDLAWFKSSIDKTLGVAIDAKTRSLEWADSLATLASDVKDNGSALNDHTVKGRANTEALLTRLQAAKDNAQADADSGMALDQVKSKYDTNIEQLRAAAIKAGLNKTAVDKLVSAYGTLPANVTTVINADTAKATRAIAIVKAQYDGLQAYMNTHPIETAAHFGWTPPPLRRSGGGPVHGPGTGTSDSVKARLSNGEYVMRKAAVDRYGDSFMNAVNSGRYASGGPVGATTSLASQQLMVTFTGTQPIELKIGDQAIYRALLRVKADRGGASLGL